MNNKITKTVFAALIDDLKDTNKHKFDLLEVKLKPNTKDLQSKSLSPPIDLDNYDSDSETFSERTSGFLFKDSYFEDREVENLVLEYDPSIQSGTCACEQCIIEPITLFEQQNTDRINSGNNASILMEEFIHRFIFYHNRAEIIQIPA